MVFIQRCINVDATSSMRCCINVMCPLMAISAVMECIASHATADDFKMNVYTLRFICNLSQGRNFLWFHVCHSAREFPSEKGSTLWGKNVLPEGVHFTSSGSKFFPYIDPFSEMAILDFDRVISQLAFYVNLHRAVIGPSATLTGRWQPDIDLRI